MTPRSMPDSRVGEEVRARYGRFIAACRSGEGFRLTTRSEPTPYALCFAIFGSHLLREQDLINAQRDRWDAELRRNIRAFRADRRASTDLARDKPFLQLLSFTLSALAVLGTLNRDPLADFVLPLLPQDVEAELQSQGIQHGAARSGNQAMFLGILLLHAQAYMSRDTARQVADWVNFHQRTMNRFGFWGGDASMSHLQFQNGYHQYELLEYLEVQEVPWDSAADAVASLADAEGHFAPYPGGGGCYDYDAVFMLTATPSSTRRHAELLARTFRALLHEQNPDGGFCESHRVRPRSFDNLMRTCRHVAAATGQARRERLRQALTLLRPRHDRVHTHWTRYSREWGESDLWDSWFRMLTMARIECAFDPERGAHWGFIDYPGIGFHPAARPGHPR